MALDPNRHYVALLNAGKEGEIRIKIGCGSQLDVAISQISGVFVNELTDDVVNIQRGPLLIDCERHGKFLGVLEILRKSPDDDTGSAKVSMPLLMIPLANVEHVTPYGFC